MGILGTFIVKVDFKVFWATLARTVLLALTYRRVTGFLLLLIFLLLVMFGWRCRIRGSSRQSWQRCCLLSFLSSLYNLFIELCLVHDSEYSRYLDQLIITSCKCWRAHKRAHSVLCKLLRLDMPINSCTGSVVFCTTISSLLDDFFHSFVDRTSNLFLRFISCGLKKSLRSVSSHSVR